MDNRRHHVNEEEAWNDGEDQSDEVARQADIDLAIALERTPCFPHALVVRCCREGSLLLAETWDFQVDSCAHLSLDFEAFDHLNDLALLLIGRGEVGTDLAQVLM